MALPDLGLLFRSMDDGGDAGDRSRDSIVRSRPLLRLHSEADDRTATQALASRLLAGDVSAFDEIFYDQFPRLVTYVRRFVDAVDVAEDIAQDALIQLWNQRATLRPDTSFVPLLRTIARRGALRQVHHFNVSSRVHEAFAVTAEPDEDNGMGVTGNASAVPSDGDAVLDVDYEELVGALRQVLASLPPRTRLVAVMHWLDQLGRQSIAAELGVSVRTVDAQLYSAGAKIRAALERYRPRKRAD